jgi:hypothetical protein
MINNIGHVEQVHSVSFEHSTYPLIKALLKYIDRFYVFIISIQKAR